MGVEFPVAGMDHDPLRRAQDKGLRLRHGMGDGDEAQVEFANGERATGRDRVDGHLLEQLRLPQLAPQHGGGKRRGIDRAAQLRPQVGHGAQMVLMRMGDDQTDQILAAFGDEDRIRQQDLGLRRVVAAEADATVHRQPAIALAVEVEVHPDFACSPQREKFQCGHVIHMIPFCTLFIFPFSDRQGRTPHQNSVPTCPVSAGQKPSVRRLFAPRSSTPAKPRPHPRHGHLWRRSSRTGGSTQVGMT